MAPKTRTATVNDRGSLKAARTSAALNCPMIQAVSTPISRKKSSTFRSIGFTRIGPSKTARIVKDVRITVIISTQLIQHYSVRAITKTSRFLRGANWNERAFGAPTPSLLVSRWISSNYGPDGIVGRDRGQVSL